MFALPLLANLTKAAGPTKDETKAEADRVQQGQEGREAIEKATEAKRNELDVEAGVDPDKENVASKVCMCMIFGFICLCRSPMKMRC